MFTAYNKVRMHDVDMAGILYFARQFRFAHDAFEDLLDTMNMDLNKLFCSLPFIFVIVHAEADYLLPLHLGDKLLIELSVEKVGNTSFSILYKIFKKKELTGTVKTIHVCLDTNSRKKIPIPEEFRAVLVEYSSTTHDRIDE